MTKLGATAGGRKRVIITAAVQAVGCCMAYFHANNYNFSSKLLLEISEYFVIYFLLIKILTQRHTDHAVWGS